MMALSLLRDYIWGSMPFSQVWDLETLFVLLLMSLCINSCLPLQNTELKFIGCEGCRMRDRGRERSESMAVVAFNKGVLITALLMEEGRKEHIYLFDQTTIQYIFMLLHHTPVHYGRDTTDTLTLREHGWGISLPSWLSVCILQLNNSTKEIHVEFNVYVTDCYGNGYLHVTHHITTCIHVICSVRVVKCNEDVQDFENMKNWIIMLGNSCCVGCSQYNLDIPTSDVRNYVIEYNLYK